MFLDLARDFIDLDQYEPRGCTVLSAACSRPEVLRLLLDRGANPLVRHLFTNETCLHEAVRSLTYGGISFNHAHDKACLKILLESGLRITDKDCFGRTPLNMARYICFARRRILEEALTECGIEFDSLINDGEECPGDVHHNVMPYCYCDPNWRTLLYDDKGCFRRWRFPPAFTSSQEDISDQSEDGTRNSPLQALRRTLQICPRMKVTSTTISRRRVR